MGILTIPVLTGILYIVLSMMGYTIESDDTIYKGGLKISRTTTYNLENVQDLIELANVYFKNNNDLKAIEMLEKAAHKQDPSAQFTLGNCYEHGRCSLKQDYRKAAEYYLLAFAKINQMTREQSQILKFNLANFYREGLGVSKDIERAIELYTVLSEEVPIGTSVIDSWVALGHIYYFGNGVEPNLETALKFYQMAADKGDEHAQVNLGEAYLTGRGMPQDNKKAFELFRMAAEKNEPYGLNNLALFYIEGIEVEKNITKGIELLKRAAQLGNKFAINNLKELEKKGFNIN